MILLDPEDDANYYTLAKLYEDAGLYELAESTFLRVREVRPDDTAVFLQLAGFYKRQGEFEKEIEALNSRASREPDNPEAHYMIATSFWEKAFRDFRLTQDEAREYVMGGLEAVDKALDLRDGYVEALIYKGILLRLQANTETDLEIQQALIAEADELRDRAEEIRLASGYRGGGLAPARLRRDRCAGVATLTEIAGRPTTRRGRPVCFWGREERGG